ncbi:MAG: UvrD-helicase domain-containing protein [Candidatus Nanosyncoccus sp.]
MRSGLDYKFVEGYSLDRQQVESIENDSQNTLVIAGAGTGKTTTIIGKIKWILNKWLKNKSETLPRILVISFTHATRVELEKRVLVEVLKNDEIFKIYHPSDFLRVETFHSLALKIMRSARRNKRAGPEKMKLSEVDFEDFLKQARLNIPEEEAEVYDRLYYLMRNYHIEYQDLKQTNSTEYPWFWQKELRLKNLKQIQKMKGFERKYKKEMASRGEVDFAGFLEEAIKSLTSIKNSARPEWFKAFCFNFVIIDEYQDISPLEYALIRNLREKQNFRLFCVGDDWQTIYQFAGSEIGLILDFKKYWGETKIFKIERTYRFPEQLAKVSGKFIMRNKIQLIKDIRGINCRDPDQIVEINGPSERTDLNSLYFFFLNLPRNARVFLLGRYNFDIKKISHCEFLNFDYETNEPRILMPERPDLNIKFCSAHKSKGLQADYVFIVNCRDATLGFPSQVKEKELITLARKALLQKNSQMKLGNSQKGKFLNMIWKNLRPTKDDEFAEERRLFYVAMTRVRKKIFFLTVQEKESPFILELREENSLKTYVID